jgi:hypothetical protein
MKYYILYSLIHDTGWCGRYYSPKLRASNEKEIYLNFYTPSMYLNNYTHQYAKEMTIVSDYL